MDRFLQPVYMACAMVVDAREVLGCGVPIYRDNVGIGFLDFPMDLGII